MTKKNILVSLILILTLTASTVMAQKGKHSVEARNSEFMLDRKPFQIISGEMHPARIPVEYWQHRIQMAKAMGLNTISAGIFWNYHEIKEGEFDFTSENRNIIKFLETVQEEKIWLILKPGPETSAEWESGGIPPYLLRNRELKLKSIDAGYTAAAERYVSKLSEQIKPFLATNGGPILMLQIEDNNDENYIKWLKDAWAKNDIDVPVLTGKEALITVPVFITGQDGNKSIHWGGAWNKADTARLVNEVKSLMDDNKSFNIYVVHGGTNFGYTAGACSGGNGYQPDITSYDFEAPVNEQGVPSGSYIALRKLLESYLPKGKKLEGIPKQIPAFEIPALSMQPFTSLWDNLPQPVSSEFPMTFEDYGQDYGYILYKTELKGEKTGKLVVTDVHDFATVFLDGQYVGTLNRIEGINSIDLPASQAEVAVLEILVEAMGRIAPEGSADRKGITEKVTLNGTGLTSWKIYNLPMDWKFIYGLRSTGKNLKKPGIFFKGNFSLIDRSDTFFDISGYTKGVVWINGHNLGRFWNAGPQKRLYCPASWIKAGMNEIIIFDQVQTEARPFSSFATME